jgi:hypothetical protein
MQTLLAANDPVSGKNILALNVLAPFFDGAK